MEKAAKYIEIILIIILVFIILSCVVIGVVGSVIQDRIEKMKYTYQTVIEDEDFNGKVLIKEWQKLFQGGADIYYVSDSGEETLIYDISYTYEGPGYFECGRFSISVDNGIMSIKIKGSSDRAWVNKSEKCGDYGNLVEIVLIKNDTAS